MNPHCTVCNRAGMPSSHRMGSKTCGSVAAAVQARSKSKPVFVRGLNNSSSLPLDNVL